jgi:hypothetical protein
VAVYGTFQVLCARLTPGPALGLQPTPTTTLSGSVGWLTYILTAVTSWLTSISSSCVPRTERMTSRCSVSRERLRTQACLRDRPPTTDQCECRFAIVFRQATHSDTTAGSGDQLSVHRLRDLVAAHTAQQDNRVATVWFGAPCTIRTCDLLVRRPVQGLGLAGFRACSSGRRGVVWGVRVQIVH